MSKLDNSKKGAQVPPVQPQDSGFWRDLWAVLRATIPGTDTEAGERKGRLAFLTGLVVPVTMAAFALGHNQLGYEAMTWLAGLYVALVALFGVHAAPASDDVAVRMKRIMPLLTISSAVTAALVVVCTFLVKAFGIL
jgi:hypothetical protein